MAILTKCASCKRLGRYAKKSTSTVCAKCFQEGKASEVLLKKKDNK